MKDPFKFIVMKYFFEKYAPGVTSYLHKHRGIDGNGKSISWSDEDRDKIRAGMKKLFSDLSKF